MPPQQLFVIGHGANHPLMSNATEPGRQANQAGRDPKQDLLVVGQALMCRCRRMGRNRLGIREIVRDLHDFQRIHELERRILAALEVDGEDRAAPFKLTGERMVRM